jgi:Bacterial pre-peptidase C-terminal domain
MRVSVIGLVLLACTLVLVPGVSAQLIDHNAGYSATRGGNIVLPAIMSPMTVGTITTGESDWYSIVVPSGRTSLTVDLNWGYAPDSLSLTAIAPDGTVGPDYDADDGVTDGRIFLTISRASGIAPGTWNFRVYGVNVLGTQSYNFVTY